VLCSDGLSNAVSSNEIAGVVSAEAGISAACDRLVKLANERGGPDNITIVLARVAR
jgi:protein phosphatase